MKNPTEVNQPASQFLTFGALIPPPGRSTSAAERCMWGFVAVVRTACLTFACHVWYFCDLFYFLRVWSWEKFWKISSIFEEGVFVRSLVHHCFLVLSFETSHLKAALHWVDQACICAAGGFHARRIHRASAWQWGIAQQSGPSRWIDSIIHGTDATSARVLRLKTPPICGSKQHRQ